MTEVRTVDPDTGGAKGQKPAQPHLTPASVLTELFEHYGRGELKYASDPDGTPNYTKGYRWSLSYDAALRHLLLFWGGEDVDPETGTKHVISAAWHCIALAFFMDERRDKDDRWQPKKPCEPELMPCRLCGTPTLGYENDWNDVPYPCCTDCQTDDIPF